MSAALSALLLTRLGMATLVFTASAGLLTLARGHLRAWIGAQALYGLWLAVPVGVALCCWPVHRVLVRVRLPMDAPTPAGAAASTVPATASILPDAATLLLAVWLLGAAASVLLFVLRQRRCQRALGLVRHVGDDTWLSTRSDLGPMLAGLPRPRIVLPADFYQRYTPDEQAAILAHERTHRQRGDLWWNALAAVLRCAFWFHPLAAPAQRRYLADQELACDSAVLRTGQHARRTYAHALLKTQAGASLPLACTMQAGLALKERILNLQAGVAPRRLRVAALLVLASLGAMGARLAWAASLQVVKVGVKADVAAPAAASQDTGLAAALDVSVDGGPTRHQETTLRDSLHLDGLRDADGRACDAELTAQQRPGNLVDLRMRLMCDGQIAGNPRLIARLGEPATIAIGRTERQPDGSYLTTHGFRLTVRFDKP